MKQLPENIILEKNKVASNSAWLVLLEIKLNNVENTTFRLVRNTEDIVYKDETYTAFPFELEPATLDSKGTIPSVELKVSNISHILQPFLLELRGGVGSTVLITVVNSALLTENFSELEMEFLITGTYTDRSSVVFRLGAINPLLQRFPLYKYIGQHCRWKFQSVECGYTGMAVEAVSFSTASALTIQTIANHNLVSGDKVRLYNYEDYFTGQPDELTITTAGAKIFSIGGVLGASLTPSTLFSYLGGAGYIHKLPIVCNRTLIQCRKYNRSSNFGGFPGMRSRSIRVV